MHKRDWLHRASPRQFVNHIHEIEGISQPLSEHQILEVQEKFLSNGFQYIKFSSIEEGRSIIEAFLQTLPLYHDIACLTTQNPSLKRATNIYQLLEGGGYLSSFEHYYLEEYFIEHFYFDFMWIEATLDLLTSTWFEEVKKILIQLAIDQHIPILICVYSPVQGGFR